MVNAVTHFSKYGEAVPVCQKSAVEDCNFLFSLMSHYGILDAHITNQGREFENKVPDELYKMANITYSITSVHHLQTNGLVKWMNHTIQIAILK